MKPLTTTLRRLGPLIAIVFGFAAIPPLTQKFFAPELTTATLRPLATRRPLPEFKVEDDLGRAVSLERFRGTFVLLNIWATWCPPCKEEMPSLNRLAAKFAPENLKVIPVSIDLSGARAVRAFYKRMGLDKLPIYVDPSKDVMRSLGVVGIPTTILIDRTGLEIGQFAGAAQWDAPAFVAWLAKLIADDQSEQTKPPPSNRVPGDMPAQTSAGDAMDAAEQEIQLMRIP